MFTKIEDFEKQWENESKATQRIMDALTDAALDQRVAPDHRTLEQLAWHLVTTMHEMLSRTGLDFESVQHEAPVPSSASAIADAYKNGAQALAEAVRTQWTDETLAQTDNMYGEEWPKGLTLHMLILHEVHHRGQMTVLMRQAGLRVPGMYGPAREEWMEMGAQPPAV